MNVILSNHSRELYGQLTVPLPIPDEEYDQVIEMLEALEIGDFRVRDCHVVEIRDCPPVLKRLEGTAINIDELDYLAKRLDSFVPKELAAFQGMVEKLGYTEVSDMINLSFCCDQVTVITDFSDMAAVGRNHVLTQQGAVSVEELEKIDLAGIGRGLFASGKGTVTPYGIVFDNDVEVVPLVRGRGIPRLPLYSIQDRYGNVFIFSSTCIDGEIAESEPQFLTAESEKNQHETIVFQSEIVYYKENSNYSVLGSPRR